MPPRRPAGAGAAAVGGAAVVTAGDEDGAGRQRRNGSSADAVARHVRRLILDGALHPGQRLPQDDIAAAVGVSRIPVREAIIALEREGWLRVEPHRGAFVTRLDEREVLDHYELYGRYFAFAARRAIDRMGPGEVDVLRNLAGELAVAKGPDAVDVANRRYLTTLFRYAESNRLQLVLRSMAEVVPDNFFAVVPSAMVTQKKAIAAVQRAIEREDADRAESALLEALRSHAVRVTAMLGRRRSASRVPSAGPAGGSVPRRGG